MLHTSVSSEGLLSPLVRSFASSLEYRVSSRTTLTPRPTKELVREYAPFSVFPDDTVDNGNILILHIVYDDLSDRGILQQIAIPQEQQISSLEGRLHRSRQNDDDRGRRVGNNREAFPHLRLIWLEQRIDT